MFRPSIYMIYTSRMFFMFWDIIDMSHMIDQHYGFQDHVSLTESVYFGPFSLFITVQFMLKLVSCFDLIWWSAFLVHVIEWLQNVFRCSEINQKIYLCLRQKFQCKILGNLHVLFVLALVTKLYMYGLYMICGYGHDDSPVIYTV